MILIALTGTISTVSNRFPDPEDMRHFSWKKWRRRHIYIKNKMKIFYTPNLELLSGYL